MFIIIPSFLICFCLNIPKFFEAELVTYQLVEDDHNTTCDITLYDATPLRVDPDYVFYYVHWTRLVWLGTMGMIRNIFKIYLHCHDPLHLPDQHPHHDLQEAQEHQEVQDQEQISIT